MRRKLRKRVCGCVYNVGFCSVYKCNVIFTYPNYPGLSFATSSEAPTALFFLFFFLRLLKLLVFLVSSCSATFEFGLAYNF